MSATDRRELLDRLAVRIDAVRRPHPVRVAVDGVDGAGKTTLVDELVPPLRALGRPVVRASIDGFHRPRAERHRRGVESPRGYYLDSFDHAAILAHLLDPLGPGGSRRVRTALFDHRADRGAPAPLASVSPEAVLLFDGVFLRRPELADAWDFHLFVHADPEIALRRALRRDAAVPGSPAAVEERYRRRYLPGRRLHLVAVRPADLADAVVDNSDPERPRLVR